ncbi:hypothetical protein J6590_107403, partial [Homalodisca vitripennis]
VCQECSGFIGTARLCPHSFSPPVTITPLKTNWRSSSYTTTEQYPLHIYTPTTT